MSIENKCTIEAIAIFIELKKNINLDNMFHIWNNLRCFFKSHKTQDVCVFSDNMEKVKPVK